MSPKAPEPQELGETLTRHYRLACELCNTYPVGRYTHQFSQGNLHVNVAEIEPEQLEAICYTLNNKVTPVGINFYIPNKRNVEIRIIHRLIDGLSTCVLQSTSLKTLQLQNIDIKGKLLSSLCKALSKTKKLCYFSLVHCKFGDAGTEQLCQSIKNVPSLFHLTLVGCHISEKGAKAVAKLIQHQSLNRDSAMWQDTLRVGQPILDNMRGLRRVTLSLNPQLGDEGVISLSQVLKEDLWIKAIDLHHCGVSNEGGVELLKLVKMNQILEVLDVRQNPFLDQKLIHNIIAALSGRSQEYAPHHYEWLPLLPEDHFPMDASVADVTKLSPNTSGCSVDTRRHNTSLLIHKLGTAQQVFSKKPQMPEKPGIPWRVEHRIYERKCEITPGCLRNHIRVSEKAHIIELNVYSKVGRKKVAAAMRRGVSLGETRNSTNQQLRNLSKLFLKPYEFQTCCRAPNQHSYPGFPELFTGYFIEEIVILSLKSCFYTLKEAVYDLANCWDELPLSILAQSYNNLLKKNLLKEGLARDFEWFRDEQPRARAVVEDILGKQPTVDFGSQIQNNPPEDLLDELVDNLVIDLHPEDMDLNVIIQVVNHQLRGSPTNAADRQQT
ncbi:unnamed protein product, partial [Meganyctiphanes norvegica]